MSHHRIPLSQNWTFHQTTALNDACASSPLPVSQFPTVAHLDLLHHALIPDPSIDTNELSCLWINDADWTYTTKFTLPAQTAQDSRTAHLVFDGLDTIVSVYLDGKLILEGENMHISYRVDVTTLLFPATRSTEHLLELKFSNAPAHAKAEMKRIGYRGNGTDVHFGGPERLFVRKAQYHWGWDWGPALNTCGPWKPIYIELFNARIADFLVRQEVSPDLGAATIKVTGSVDGLKGGHVVNLEVKSPDGKEVLGKEVVVEEDGTFKADLVVDKPELWWPFTYGAQPLYTITATLPDCDAQSRKLGFRRLRLLQNPLKNEPGTSFTFEINNTRIFCGGSVWTIVSML
jgi:beta-mannosidase